MLHLYLFSMGHAEQYTQIGSCVVKNAPDANSMYSLFSDMPTLQSLNGKWTSTSKYLQKIDTITPRLIGYYKTSNNSIMWKIDVPSTQNMHLFYQDAFKLAGITTPDLMAAFINTECLDLIQEWMLMKGHAVPAYSSKVEKADMVECARVKNLLVDKFDKEILVSPDDRVPLNTKVLPQKATPVNTFKPVANQKPKDPKKLVKVPDPIPIVYGKSNAQPVMPQAKIVLPAVFKTTIPPPDGPIHTPSSHIAGMSAPDPHIESAEERKEKDVKKELDAHQKAKEVADRLAVEQMLSGNPLSALFVAQPPLSRQAIAPCMIIEEEQEQRALIEETEFHAYHDWHSAKSDARSIIMKKRSKALNQEIEENRRRHQEWMKKFKEQEEKAERDKQAKRDKQTEQEQIKLKRNCGKKHPKYRYFVKNYKIEYENEKQFKKACHALYLELHPDKISQRNQDLTPAELAIAAQEFAVFNNLKEQILGYC